MAKKTKLPTATLTKKRMTLLNARTKEATFIENWKSALQKIPASEFLMGKSGWRANIDWFLSTDAVVKIVEGKYDNAKLKYESENSEEYDVGF